MAAIISIDSKDVTINRGRVDEVFKHAREVDLAKTNNGGTTVPPTKEQFTTTDPIVMSPTDVSNVLAERSELLIVGGVVYDDIFGKTHETEICRSILGIYTSSLHYCMDHNVMR